MGKDGLGEREGYPAAAAREALRPEQANGDDCRTFMTLEAHTGERVAARNVVLRGTQEQHGVVSERRPSVVYWQYGRARVMRETQNPSADSHRRHSLTLIQSSMFMHHVDPIPRVEEL